MIVSSSLRALFRRRSRTALALAGIGVAGTLLGPRGGGPAVRVTGRRRLVRLAELVGDPPAEAPAGTWPG